MDSKKFALVGLVGLVLAGAGTAKPKAPKFEDLESIYRSGHYFSDGFLSGGTSVIRFKDEHSIQAGAPMQGSQGVTRNGDLVLEGIRNTDIESTTIESAYGTLGMHYGFDDDTSRYLFTGSGRIVVSDGLGNDIDAFTVYFYARDPLVSFQDLQQLSGRTVFGMKHSHQTEIDRVIDTEGMTTEVPGERSSLGRERSDTYRSQLHSIDAIWSPDTSSDEDKLEELRQYLFSGNSQSAGGVHYSLEFNEAGLYGSESAYLEIPATSSETPEAIAAVGGGLFGLPGGSLN